MDRSITRRDFLNGVATTSIGTMIPSKLNAAISNATYPPALTGLRGSHTGAIEVAHLLGRYGQKEWGTIYHDDTTTYDLVVVGAGISGLSAAHFFLKEHPQARILILDNHDDFGGHAKRNEFHAKGRMILSHGGSQTLQEPSEYSAVARSLLTDIGIDLDRLKATYDQDFYERHTLTDCTYFDKATYGVDKVVQYPASDYSTFVPSAAPQLSPAEAVAQMPLPAATKQQYLKLLQMTEDKLAHIPADKKREYLWTTSYRTFLNRDLGITDPVLMDLFQGLTTDACVSIERASALEMMGYMGLPGINATGLNNFRTLSEPYRHHFPDGNATLTRLMVRKMIPATAPGNSMEDIITAPFDYSQLDDPDSKVRIRLNSTVVNTEHEGAVESAKTVKVTYVQEGRSQQIRAKACVMAGYNSMVRFICPELPESQKQALTKSVKSPIIYTNVLLNNWHAHKNLGIGSISSPGAYYAVGFLDFPVNIGAYHHAKGPDDPIIFHLERFPTGDDPTASNRDQMRAGRLELFSTPFKKIEQETHRQLTGMLSAGGFDPVKDIAAITVNRWGHGYSGSYGIDEEHPPGEWPHQVGRKRFGRITIANSDAGASASVDAAIDQAFRAVSELA